MTKAPERPAGASAAEWSEAMKRAQEARSQASRKGAKAELRKCQACGVQTDHRSKSTRCPHHQLELMRRGEDYRPPKQLERPHQKKKHPRQERQAKRGVKKDIAKKKRAASEWTPKPFDPKPEPKTPEKAKKDKACSHASLWQEHNLVDILAPSSVAVARAMVDAGFYGAPSCPRAAPTPSDSDPAAAAAMSLEDDPRRANGHVCWRCSRAQCAAHCRVALEPEGERLVAGKQDHMPLPKRCALLWSFAQERGSQPAAIDTGVIRKNASDCYERWYTKVVEPFEREARSERVLSGVCETDATLAKKRGLYAKLADQKKAKKALAGPLVKFRGQRTGKVEE